MDIFHRKSLKKGQAAIEFLMTYGWMLLIVLIVGALIFSFVDFGSLLPNTLDLNNNLRGEPTQSQASLSAGANGAVLVTFVYNGNDRIRINSSGDRSFVSDIEGATGNCTLNYVKNADTNFASALTSPGFGVISTTLDTAPLFLRGQTGVAEFNCVSYSMVENDVLDGRIRIIMDSTRTGVPVRSEGDIRMTIGP